MLIRDDVAPASILLVSDLETAPTDLTALGQTLSRIERSSTTMRVVPLASIDGLNFFGRILGTTRSSIPSSRTPERRRCSTSR